MQVGEVEYEAGPGTIIWAPAGVPHGVLEAQERSVLLVAMGPPPR
jgi:quercetin dioxygenase-like cupin family protein